ncbi:conserved hypothetical protein [Neospora caninum Liverpool]|uniref:Uncharacterized protein n=1 Tax=Neospora caninum (strain Liverpool) TaxID=572307 RepID=F0V9N0_NEOCL|nr:conserved hypothetical protein [Neospora caninum Liverpool]CBZ50456.1 conserved hypothetical protein [Neospora caninum Liverpool]CEL65065.1 TPA: hypothetical protein BN1204_009250 [Neospora caninum Liverpool]|eukprot:XP_003880489.1 conserved hypothetical protein [Neospora caninum Liverpool]
MESAETDGWPEPASDGGRESGSGVPRKSPFELSVCSDPFHDRADRLEDAENQDACNQSPDNAQQGVRSGLIFSPRETSTIIEATEVQTIGKQPRYD